MTLSSTTRKDLMVSNSASWVQGTICQFHNSCRVPFNTEYFHENLWLQAGLCLVDLLSTARQGMRHTVVVCKKTLYSHRPPRCRPSGCTHRHTKTLCRPEPEFRQPRASPTPPLPAAPRPPAPSLERWRPQVLHDGLFMGSS